MESGDSEFSLIVVRIGLAEQGKSREMVALSVGPRRIACPPTNACHAPVYAAHEALVLASAWLASKGRGTPGLA